MSSDPTKILEWTPEYAVHVAELDREHQEWFAVVTRLHEAMLEGRAKALLKTLFGEMEKYTSEHFAHEEEWMAAVHYPGRQKHLRKHDELRSNATAFRERFERGEVTLTIELTLFLFEWIKRHVMTTDRQLGDYLRTRKSVPPAGANS